MARQRPLETIQNSEYVTIGELVRPRQKHSTNKRTTLIKSMTITLFY